MKKTSMLLLAALLIGGSFAFLLVRLARVERENDQLRTQIASAVHQKQERAVVNQEPEYPVREYFDGYQDPLPPSPMDSLIHENARQREQIAVMRESAARARAAFDRMQMPLPEPMIFTGSFNAEECRQIRQYSDSIRQAYVNKLEAPKRLEAEIETLQAVSREGQ